MQVITSKRRSGKTTKLIRLCAEKGGYIVCVNRHHAHGIAQMAKDMELNIPLPITFDEFIARRYYGSGVGKFFIDDADLLLQRLSAIHIEAITLTTKE